MMGDAEQRVTELLAAFANGETFRCSNPASWHPTMHAKQEHHHPPLAWRSLYDASAARLWWHLIRLCGLCHDEYHTLLNLFIHYDGRPPWALRRSFSPYVSALVAEAWKNRPVPKPPYT